VNEPFQRSETFVVSRGPIPESLQAGTLYVNPQGTRAHHLCACGCDQRVMTPLNDIEWELTGTDDRPSLRPSVGNWNLDCRSHYVLSEGRVHWARRFSQSEIEAVRRKDLRPYQQTSWVQKVGEWIERVVRFFRRS
jgi:hypothetical protein